MNTKDLVLENLEDLDWASSEILGFAKDTKVYAFYGEMGAGKTTLIKEICSKLKVIDNVSSPTFSIVNEYQSASGEVIYHFDFYRIKSITEALDLGFEEYLNSGSLCLIEWPERIDNLLPLEILKIEIKLLGSTRVITLKN